MRRRSPVLCTSALSLTLVLGLLVGSALPVSGAGGERAPDAAPGPGLLAGAWHRLWSAVTALLPPLPAVLATDEGSGDDPTGEDPTGGDPSGGLDPGSGGGVMDPNG